MKTLAALLLFTSSVNADYQLYVVDLNKPVDNGYQIIHTERFIAKSDCRDRGFDYQNFAGYFGGRTGFVCSFIGA